VVTKKKHEKVFANLNTEDYVPSDWFVPVKEIREMVFTKLPPVTSGFNFTGLIRHGAQSLAMV